MKRPSAFLEKSLNPRVTTKNNPESKTPTPLDHLLSTFEKHHFTAYGFLLPFPFESLFFQGNPLLLVLDSRKDCQNCDRFDLLP
jgi:hypothetical protein